jgi:DNA-binding Lrp family transcriptional regulator
MPSQVSPEEFYGLRVRIVLELLRNGPMTQSALVRELGTNAKFLRRHLNWLVRNGIVKAFGSVATLYEVNTEHPLIKWVVGLINPQGGTKPYATA